MRSKRLAALALSAVLTAGIGLTGCGSALDYDAVVATVNGKEISLGLANCLAQYTAVTYDTYYMQYFGADMWTSDNGGTTMTDSVKANTLEQLEEYYLLEEHAGDYGVELTAEEIAAIDEAAAQFMADNTEEGLQAMGATQEYVKEMLRLGTLQKKMRDVMVADIDRDVPDEECAQKTISYVRISKSADTSDDEEKKSEEEAAAEAKEKAQKILDAALAGSQEDPLKAAAEANDASALTCSYGKNDLEESEDSTPPLDLEALAAADKLEEKELSKKLVETDSYYYIIRMDSLFDEEATEKERESILSVRESERYTELVDGYKASADWTIDEKVWEPVNFNTIYTRPQTASGDGTNAGASDDGTAGDAAADEDAADAGDAAAADKPADGGDAAAADKPADGGDAAAADEPADGGDAAAADEPANDGKAEK